MSDKKDAFEEFFQGELKQYVGDYFDELVKSGRLSPIAKHAGYQISFISTWDRFVTGESQDFDDYQYKWLKNDLWRAFMKEMFDLKFKLRRDHPDASDHEVILKIREQMVNFVSEGNLPYPFMAIEVDSQVLKDRLVMTLHDWVPAFHKLNRETGNYERLADDDDLDVRPVTHIEVDLPSGELLICDWLRVKEFTEEMRQNDYYINFAQDRIERTLAGIRTYNLMEAAYHDRSPDVVLSGSDEDASATLLRVGPLVRDDYSDEAEVPELENQIVGNFLAEYWGVTMMDRSDFVRVLTEILGSQDEAELKLSELMDGNSYFHKPAVVKLDPGVWHYYFVEAATAVGIHSLEEATDDLGAGMRSTVVLSREPLSIREDLLRDESPRSAAPGPR